MASHSVPEADIAPGAAGAYAKARARLASVNPGSLLGFVIAGELLTLYAVLNGGGWVYDDNLFLELANAYGSSWHWLTLSVFQHFGIAHHAVFSLQNHLMPLDYRWGLLTMLLLFGASIFLLHRVLRLLVGDGWVPLLAAAWLGISVLLVRDLQWWVTGVQAFPALGGDLLCLYAYLRYQTERSRRWVLVSAGALAVALLFYEKPVFMPLYVGLIRLAFLTPNLRPRAIVNAIWTERWMWIAYIVIILVWAIGFEASGAGFSGTRSPTATEWVAFFRIFWAQTLVPGVFGLTLPHSALSTLQVVATVALQLAVIGAVGVSLRRQGIAWRAWALLGICVLLNGALVGQARIAQFAPAVGGDPRYLLDFAWLIPLLVCLAFSTRRSPTLSTPATEARVHPPQTRPVRILGITTVVALAYLTASIATATKMQREWPGHAARVWEAHFEQGLSGAARVRPRPVIAEAGAPYFMDYFPPYNQLSVLAPHYGPLPQFDGPVTSTLLMIDPAGNARPASVGTLFASNVLGHRCLNTPTAVTIQRQIRIASTQSVGPYYLLLGYTLRRSVRLKLRVDHRAATTDSEDPRISLSPAAHTSITWLGTGPPRALTIHIPPRAGVCLQQSEIVSLRAKA